MNRFTSTVSTPADDSKPAYWFLFSGYELLMFEENGEISLPLITSPGVLPVETVRCQTLGYLDVDGKKVYCISAELAEDTEPPESMVFLGLRRLFGRLDEEMLALAGRAIQIKEWDKTHQFCGQCGSKVSKLEYERAKRCQSCGHTTYPRIAPAIIVRIERSTAAGKELLLARNHRHPHGFYSVLAGFVEPGKVWKIVFIAK